MSALANSNRPRGWILPVIVVSQFLCTSLWFAGNAILSDIALKLALPPAFLADLTSAVQFGFISGTLIFAVLTISDRFSPSWVFFICSIIAGLFNLGISLDGIGSSGVLLFRFFTGFFLAGIYPVGMKIASDHYQKGLGISLGFLVGALVLGTAFPHLLKSLTLSLPWKYVVFSTSCFAALGGLAMILFVPNGQFRKPGQKMKFTAFLKGFKNQEFRSAAFGYFGHMWELYSFWAFVPLMLKAYQQHVDAGINAPLLSFLIIASGGISCVAGGLLSQRFGAKRIATIALGCSGLCCFLSPLFLVNANLTVLTCFLFFWGLTVIADSPLFSTLIARNAPEESRGSALTMVNCIGFSITIVSIQLIHALSGMLTAQYVYMVLGIGPLLGLLALMKKKRKA